MKAQKKLLFTAVRVCVDVYVPSCCLQRHRHTSGEAEAEPEPEPADVSSRNISLGLRNPFLSGPLKTFTDSG